MARAPLRRRGSAEGRPPVLLRLQDRRAGSAPAPEIRRTRPNIPPDSPNSRLRYGAMAAQQLQDENDAAHRNDQQPAPITPHGPVRPPRATAHSAPNSPETYPPPRPIDPLRFGTGGTQQPGPMPRPIRLPGHRNAPAAGGPTTGPPTPTVENAPYSPELATPPRPIDPLRFDNGTGQDPTPISHPNRRRSGHNNAAPAPSGQDTQAEHSPDHRRRPVRLPPLSTPAGPPRVPRPSLFNLPRRIQEARAAARASGLPYVPPPDAPQHPRPRIDPHNPFNRTGPTTRGTQTGPRPTRQPVVGNATIPTPRDSYPGPFKSLVEYTEPDSRPGFQFRRESHVRQPDDNAAPRGTAPRGTAPEGAASLAPPVDNNRRSPSGTHRTPSQTRETPSGTRLSPSGTRRSPSETRRSPSQTRNQTPTPAAPISDFPDGGLDIDMEDDSLRESDVEDSHKAELDKCKARCQRLNDTLTQQALDGEAQNADHREQSEVAHIEAEALREELLESQDRQLELQQQLDDAKDQAQAGNDGEPAPYVENTQVYIDQIESLAEQLREVGEQADATERQLAEANRKIDSLKARGSSSVDEEPRATDEDLLKALFDENARLTDENAALQAQPDQANPGRIQQTNDFSEQAARQAAELKEKADRLDALWDTLRNFQDQEDQSEKESVLQARITYLETLAKNARAQIDGTGDIEDVEQDGNDCQDQVVELERQINVLKLELCDASSRILSAENNAEFWKKGGPDLSNHRFDHMRDAEEAAKNRPYFDSLILSINTLQSELHEARVDREVLSKQVRCFEDGSDAAAKATESKRLQEDLEATDAHVNVLNGRVADTENELKASKAANRQLRRKMRKDQAERAVEKEQLDGLVAFYRGLEEEVPKSQAELAASEAKVLSLQDQLAAAVEEINELRDEQNIIYEPETDSSGTSSEPDELPVAKRPRRYSSQVGDDGRGDGSDNAISISSDESSGVSSSEEGDDQQEGDQEMEDEEEEVDQEEEDEDQEEDEEEDEDEEEARFQRDVAAARPRDRRGGVVVIDHRGSTRSSSTAETNSSKRKRYY